MELVITIKTLSWIIATVLLLGFNIFFNKEERGGGYGPDLAPLFRFGLSMFCYLIFWIVWLIIY